MNITEKTLRSIIREMIISEGSVFDALTPPARVVGQAISHLLNSPELAEQVRASSEGSDPDTFMNDVLRFTKVNPFRSDLDKLSQLITQPQPSHHF